MSDRTPEELAKEFARRWLSEFSAAMREMGEKEIAKLIRDAVDLDRKRRDKSRAA